jgi:hypothetical protein
MYDDAAIYESRSDFILKNNCSDWVTFYFMFDSIFASTRFLSILASKQV